jgi:hypothetical protein
MSSLSSSLRCVTLRVTHNLLRAVHGCGGKLCLLSAPGRASNRKLEMRAEASTEREMSQDAAGRERRRHRPTPTHSGTAPPTDPSRPRHPALRPRNPVFRTNSLPTQHELDQLIPSARRLPRNSRSAGSWSPTTSGLRFDLDPLPDGAGAHAYVPQNMQPLELALSPPAPVPQSAAQPQPPTATQPVTNGHGTAPARRGRRRGGDRPARRDQE